MKRIGFFFCCLALVLSASPAFARERILRMDVRALVSPDATLTVIECIGFVAEGKEIRRGLVRVLPLLHRQGAHMITDDFALLSATLDGRAVSFDLRREGGEMELHLGDDSFLSHGMHTYVLTYTLTRQLTFHDDGDELYWNVTGDDWIFPIEAASFTLVPPEGATVFEVDAWTGTAGSRKKNWQHGSDGALYTTRPLAPGEGFTVSATWTKGFVTPPPEAPWDRASPPWLRPLYFLFTFLIALWYGGWWFAVGRDPKPGVVIPLFEPPMNLEPAFVRYIDTLRFDSDALLADLVDLAVRGFLVLDPGSEREGCLRVFRTSKEWNAELSPAHRALLERLFKEGGGAVLGGGTGGKAAREFTKGLVKDLPSFYGIGARQAGTRQVGARPVDSVAPRPALVRKNPWPCWAGLLFFLPPLLLLPRLETFALQAGARGRIPFLPVFVGLFSFIFCVWTLNLLPAFRRKRLLGPAAGSGTLIPFLIGGVFVVGYFLLFKIFRGLLSFYFATDFWATAAFCVATFLAVLFAFLMPQRTSTGRMLLDRVEGFTLYLATAERHRLETLYPAVRGQVPEPTPELFERLLPYAFALDVATTWIDAFGPLLREQNYRPAWHSGSGPFNAAGFRSSMAAMSSSVGASSGRGGRGSSGGGGGGGGGRGR